MSETLRQFMFAVANDLSCNFAVGVPFTVKDAMAYILPNESHNRLGDSIVEDLTVKGFLRKQNLSVRKKVFYVLPFQKQKTQFSSAQIAFNYLKTEYINCLKSKQNSTMLAQYFNYVSECTNGKSKNWLHFNICEILYNEQLVTSFYMGNKKMFKAKKQSLVQESFTMRYIFQILKQNIYKIWLCEFFVFVVFMIFQKLHN